MDETPNTFESKNPTSRDKRSIVFGRFEVVRELGRGSGGVVFLVYDRLRRSRVVLKHLWPRESEAEEWKTQEVQENFTALTRLRHPSLPVLLDWGQDENGRTFYTKVFTEGESGDTSCGKISFPEVAKIAFSLAETVGLLHRSGYCHGDLKPDNLLISRVEGHVIASLIDFGLAFSTSKAVQGVRGTALYMAPELLREGAMGPESDIYSLGATLYHLSYGTPPFSDIKNGEKEVKDAIVERIVKGEVQHPAAGFVPPDAVDDRLAFDAIKKCIEGLMSSDADSRRQTFAELPKILSAWSPPQEREEFGHFVGRLKEIEAVKDWVKLNLNTPQEAKPLMTIHGPQGIGKGRLWEVVSAELRSENTIVIEHRPVDVHTDTFLEDLTRQLLILVPGMPEENRSALLNEVSLNHLGTESSQGGEDAKKQRLLRHIIGVARQIPLIFAVRKLSSDHACRVSVEKLNLALEADRTRAEPARIAVVMIENTSSSTDLVIGIGQALEVGPLDHKSIGDFIECALPESARPANVEEVARLTKGIPVRLVEMARTLLAAAQNGQQPSGATLRRAADMEGELTKRISRLGVAARSVLFTLALLDRALTLEELKTVVKASPPKIALMNQLCGQGLVHRQKQDILGPIAHASLFKIENDTIRAVVVNQRWPDAIPKQAVLERFTSNLESLYSSQPGFEAIELLLWAERAGRQDIIQRHCLVIGRSYRINLQQGLARQSFEIGLRTRSSRASGKYQEELIVEAIGLYLDLNIAKEAIKQGEILLEIWMSEGVIQADIYEAFSSEANSTEDILTSSWGEALGRLPRPKPEGAVGHDQERIFFILSSLAHAMSQSGQTNKALTCLWKLINHRQMVLSGRAISPLFRALAKQLWRTSYRVDLMNAIERILASKALMDEFESIPKAFLLNLQGGLLNVSRRQEEAISAYENALFMGRIEGTNSPAVPRAMANMALIFRQSGEIPIAQHYLMRSIQIAERQGYLETKSAALRTLGDIYALSGKPYSGLMTIEESYRVELTRGRFDTLNAGLSLLNHQAAFGLKIHARKLYETLVTLDENGLAHLQYAFALVGWGDASPAKAVMTKFKQESDSLVFDYIATSRSLLEAEILLLEGRWKEAVSAAKRTLKMARSTSNETVYTKSCLRCLVEAHLEMNNLDKAARCVEELESMLLKHPQKEERSVALHLSAKIQQAKGKHTNARRLFEKAKEALDELLADMPEAYREDYLTNRHRKAIVEDTENFLQTERKRIISGMRQVLDIVQELHRSSERSLDELLSSVLDQMIDFTGAERGILFNIDPRSPDDPDQNEDAAYVTRDWLPSSEGLPSVWRVSVASARGFGQQDLNKQSAKASGTVIKRILKENGPILTADAIEDMRFSHSGSIAKLGMRSILAIPLRYDKQINGVVYLDSQEIKRFSDEDTGLLDMLGDHMGPVVERAQQREHVRAVTNMFPRIIGASEALLSVLDDASKIAGADVPVLILGSTGTGKELLAQGVHNASTRSRQSFVAFNCATLSSDLALADLFGAERGAYTGAHQARMGYFEQADGGTLFLDEIGDTPLEVQTQLLRVLQEGVYRRVGGTKDRKVDVRIIAATHWDLEKRIADGLFREDLYFRLKVVPLKLPDLRNRRRDIPTLVHFFFNLFMEKHKLSLAPPSKEVISALQEFPWPGNIRQLRNALQQAMLFSDGALTLDAIRSAAGAVENQPVEAQIPEQPVGGYGPAAFRGPAQPGAYPPGMGAWSPYPYPMWPMPYPGYPPQSGYPQGTLPPNAFGQSPQQWPAAWPQQYPSWPPTAPPTQAVPPQGSQEPGAPPAGTSQEAHSYSNAMARHRYELALKALQASNGNKTQAAAMMGITRQSLYRILAQGKA